MFVFPCSHRCYKHNNPQMSVSHITLKSIQFLHEISPISMCTFHWFHSCTGYKLRRPLIFFKCPPRELQKQRASKVSHKDRGIVFTVRQTYPFHKAGPMLHLGSIRDLSTLINTDKFFLERKSITCEVTIKNNS